MNKLIEERRIRSFFLELTNVCNFSCQFCSDHLMKREKGFMDFSLAMNCLEQLKGMKYDGNILFHLMGEPTLHKSFFDILDYNHVLKNPKPEIVTNGSVLSPMEIERLLLSPIEMVSMSVQVRNDRQFGRYHPKTSLNGKSYFKIIEKWIETLFVHHERSAPVEINLLVTRYVKPNKVSIINSMEESVLAVDFFYDMAKKVAKNKGIKDILYKKNVILKKIKYGGRVDITNKLKLRFRLAHEFAGGATMCPHKLAKRGFCSLPFYQMGVLWDGKATICCADYNGNLVIGDVKDCDIKTLWNNEKAERIRNAFLDNKVIVPFCRSCLGKPDVPWYKLTGLSKNIKIINDKILGRI